MFTKVNEGFAEFWGANRFPFQEASLKGTQNWG
jgi:hypothetical protein